MKAIVKNIFLLSAFAFVIEANINCAPAVVAAVFVPLIGAATWVNAANPAGTNTFFFFDITDNANTSSFNGNENLTGGGQASLKGSFTNHYINFTYNPGSSKKGTYQGRINDASTEITLSSPDGLPPLTLRKQ